MRKTAPIVFVAILAATGCGGSDTMTDPNVDDPIPTTEELEFVRYRDPVSGGIVPVLTETGVGFDAREVDSPAILMDPDRQGGSPYLLFYEASDAAGTARIAVVGSTNPEFSSISVPRTLVIDLGGPGSGFDAGATDPTIVLAPAGSAYRYRIWFEGRSGSSGETSQIITAVSDDALSWRDFTVCGGLDGAFGAARIADPSVVVDGATYRMWFEANGGSSGQGAIGHATSDDGLTWTIRDASGNTGMGAGPVLSARGGAGFDAVGVHAPSVAFDPPSATIAGGRWTLWYEASDNLSSTENTIGVAYSADGMNWSRLDAPALAPSSDSLVPLPFDSGDIEHPMVVIDTSVNHTVRGRYLLYYTGDGEANSSPNRIGLAYGSTVEPGDPAP